MPRCRINGVCPTIESDYTSSIRGEICLIQSKASSMKLRIERRGEAEVLQQLPTNALRRICMYQCPNACRTAIEPHAQTVSMRLRPGDNLTVG